VRHGELFGLWWIDEEHPKPWTLELLPDAHWDVRVRDERDAPMPGLSLQWLEEEGSELLARATTDADGLARFEHAGWRLAHARSAGFKLVPHAILREPVTQRWDQRQPPTAPSELVLPALGVVEVSLRDPDGAAWEFAEQDVWVRDASGARVEQSDEKQQFAHLWRDEPRYRIHAELGMQIEAGWRARGTDGELIERAVGPLEPNETVRMELFVGSHAPIARMRLLDSDGAPLSKARLSLVTRQIIRFGGGTFTAHRTTAAHGVLVVPLEPPRAGRTYVLDIELRATPSLRAELAIESELAHGWIDLGDVRFEQAALLAAGRVVDAEGQPVAGAIVELRGPNPAHAEAQAEDARIGSLTAARAVQMPELAFSSGPSWSTRTHEGGAFELHAPHVPARVQARVQLGEHFDSPWVEGLPGRSDYVLVAPPSGSAYGRVLLPEGLEARDVSLSLSKDSRLVGLRSDGSWRLSGLEPGDARIEMRDSAYFTWGPLQTLRFSVFAGERVQAPDFDLRELRVIRMSVVDEHGAPLDAKCSFGPAGEGSVGEVEVRGGKARLLTRLPRVDAWILAAGHRTAQVRDARDGERVVLLPGPVVRVRLRDASALPVLPYQLVAKIESGSEQLAFGPTGELELHAPFEGEQVVLVELRDTRWGPYSMHHRPRAQVAPLAFPVVVPESGAPIEIEVELAPRYTADAIHRFENG
jgi:hypothetical protein